MILGGKHEVDFLKWVPSHSEWDLDEKLSCFLRTRMLKSCYNLQIENWEVCFQTVFDNRLFKMNILNIEEITTKFITPIGWT